MFCDNLLLCADVFLHLNYYYLLIFPQINAMLLITLKLKISIIQYYFQIISSNTFLSSFFKISCHISLLNSCSVYHIHLESLHSANFKIYKYPKLFPNLWYVSQVLQLLVYHLEVQQLRPPEEETKFIIH